MYRSHQCFLGKKRGNDIFKKSYILRGCLGPQSRSNWNYYLEMLVFQAGRKTEEPGDKPSEQGKNQQQTRPTYVPGRHQNRVTLVGDERSHHCATLFPRKRNTFPFLTKKTCS